MKRSEMLGIICDAMLEMGFHDNGPWIHKDKLNYILTKIEEAGMLPPSTLKSMERKGTLNGKVGVMYTNELVNEWNDEDPEPNYGEP